MSWGKSVQNFSTKAPKNSHCEDRNERDALFVVRTSTQVAHDQRLNGNKDQVVNNAGEFKNGRRSGLKAFHHCKEPNSIKSTYVRMEQLQIVNHLLVEEDQAGEHKKGSTQIVAFL